MNEEENNLVNNNDANFDPIKFNRMTTRIYLLERNEIITHEKTKTEMIDSIKKIIEQEAKKCN